MIDRIPGDGGGIERVYPLDFYNDDIEGDCDNPANGKCADSPDIDAGERELAAAIAAAADAIDA